MPTRKRSMPSETKRWPFEVRCAIIMISHKKLEAGMCCLRSWNLSLVVSMLLEVIMCIIRSYVLQILITSLGSNCSACISVCVDHVSASLRSVMTMQPVSICWVLHGVGWISEWRSLQVSGTNIKAAFDFQNKTLCCSGYPVHFLEWKLGSLQNKMFRVQR
jgi:hypothetical protein